MKVLSIVSYNFLPAKMGGQKAIALFYEWLSKKINFQCISVASNNTASASYKVANILPNNKLRYFNPFIFFIVKKVVKANDVSHIIIEHPYYGWLAFLLKSFCKVKLIVRSHNIEAERFKSVGKSWWKVLWYYEKWVHSKADLSFFITENDLEYALHNFKLNPNKCTVVTYGFDLQTIPGKEKKLQALNIIREKHNINSTDKILLFNGTLSYKANLKALDIILNEINPLLLKQNSFQYKIIICGKDLPESYNELNNYINKNVIYAGFVDDIKDYYLAADIFINPVNEGGGIKTKIVEALGYNVSLVTTNSGAIGIPLSIVGDKMKVIEDDNWSGFAEAIMNIKIDTKITDDYYNYFYWDSITDKAFKAIQGC